jgi:hypothetical protein
MYRNSQVAQFRGILMYNRANSTVVLSAVWVHFGLPKSIISDRDSQFVGSFWLSLWALMDTKLKKRTAFHPQTMVRQKW